MNRLSPFLLFFAVVAIGYRQAAELFGILHDSSRPIVPGALVSVLNEEAQAVQLAMRLAF